MNITLKTSAHNTSLKSNRNIEFIVLHYTAGTSSKSGSAINVANYFARSAQEASADFIVDDTAIVQYNPDIKNRYTWAVGGSKYTTMTTSLGGIFHGVCKNNNSVSIEMCSNKRNTSTLNASDTDWYFTEATINNALELTKYLMEQYNIDNNHVIMHHHVTGKICPNPWCVNESRLQEWYKFKKKLEEDENMTQEQFNEMFITAMEAYRKTLQDNDAGDWSKTSRAWAVKSGLIQGGTPLEDGSPNYMWQDFLTREQIAALFYRFRGMK